LRRLATPESAERSGAAGPSRDAVEQLVQSVLRRLADEAGDGGVMDGTRLEEALDAVLGEQPRVYARAERDAILTAVRDEAGGYGPLDPLLRDNEVNEIMVNTPQEVYVERRGHIERAQVRFRDQAHVLQVVERILAPLGRRVDESSPMVDARLPSGARVNVIVPPVAVRGVTVTIRKFAPDAYRMTDLVQAGTLSAEMAAFLEAAVDARLNIVVSGRPTSAS
jgi:pilus assembly protein CpaF